MTGTAVNQPDSKDGPDLPWTIEADIIMRLKAASEQDAIDLTIIKYLKSGDTRALAWWLLGGHEPGKHLLNCLGYMLEPGDTPKDKVPFALVAKPRSPKRGRPPKRPEQELRDWLLFRNVEAAMERLGPGSYDSAIKEIAMPNGLEEHTVKRAYDNMKRLADRVRRSE